MSCIGSAPSGAAARRRRAPSIRSLSCEARFSDRPIAAPAVQSNKTAHWGGVDADPQGERSKHRTYDGDPTLPLLWFLRDEAGLTGTKFGCGQALCGACTVHVDGRPCAPASRRSRDVGDQEVTTIEGLHPQGNHPVQVAWRELNVPQCGFCQAGQIMQAASLLAQNPKPTDKQIREQMSGNICRCGCYQRIDGRRSQSQRRGPDHDTSLTNASGRVENVSRRGLLKGAAALGGLVLAARCCRAGRASAAITTDYATGAGGMPHGTVNDPHVFVSIAPDGIVTIVAHRSEMGTGVRTSLPMVVADEMDADWARVQRRPGAGRRGEIRQPGHRRLAQHAALPACRCARSAPRRAPCWRRPRPSTGACRSTRCRPASTRSSRVGSGGKLGFGDLAADAADAAGAGRRRRCS